MVKPMFGNLLEILSEEIALYRKVAHVAQAEKDAIARTDIDALRTRGEEKSALVETIQGLEKKRQVLIQKLSEALGCPANELNLRSLARSAEGPMAARLEALRTDLLDLTTSISEIHSRNRETIAHRLKLVRSSLSFLNHLVLGSTVYHCTGKVMATSDRSGRILSGNY